MAEIKNHIRPESVIYSDCWKGYDHNELIVAGFSHFTVNHRYNFIDPETAANTPKNRVCGVLQNGETKSTEEQHVITWTAT